MHSIMRKNYLFPTTFRKIGWCLFVPFAITSFICLFDGSNEDWLKVNALSVIPWGIIKNSLFDELSMIGLTVSLLFIAFSKEKDEDECIANIRSNSLIWATITAYSLLIVCTMLTDGFWENIEEEQMEACLQKSANPHEWLERMEKIVVKNGRGTNMDNYSAIVVFAGV